MLREAFDSVWVAGEAQRVRPNRNGHLFFELVEKGAADEIVGKLEAVIWRRDYERVRRVLAEAEQEVADGREIRCRASLDFYAPYGRMQLVVREIDVVFGLGQLAARRRATLKALAEAGLVEKNAGLQLGDHPLDLALITARESAAYHDFLETLRESGFGFRVTLFDAAMQGRAAEGAIASALAAASRLPVDACVLIRGGGSKADLAAFDSRRVAEAVAGSQVPVLTGLGHQIDESIADHVAHTALKTPTKVAEFLVERTGGADARRRALERALGEAVIRRVAAAGERLATARRRTVVVRHRLTGSRARLEELARSVARGSRRVPAAAELQVRRLEAELARRSPQVTARRSGELDRLTLDLGKAARHRVEKAQVALAGLQRLAVQLGPERVLARGFSVTRDAEGRALRRAEDIGYGQVLTTQLARGTITSRVEEG